MSFAKLYETEVGQILVKLDEGDNGAQINIYFQPENLGVCSIDFNWRDDIEKVQWEKADKAFEMMTEKACLEMVQNTLNEFTV
ncbi:MAG: hypothetical protein JKY50_00520 [Oleispira sp.]|nr:hypothetical protein [Oleispira sp.]